MLRILGIALAALFGVVVLVVVVGYTLPKQHVAARAISIHQDPTAVFALISNFADGPAWRTDLQAVEMLPPVDGRTRFREKGSNGAIVMEVAESSPPRRLITRIVDKSLAFGGVWVLDLSPNAAGTRLNITERGEIYNPVFRFVARFLVGYESTLNTYLRSVSRKFGETGVPSEGTAASL